jgi:esterase/lipase
MRRMATYSNGQLLSISVLILSLGYFSPYFLSGLIFVIYHYLLKKIYAGPTTGRPALNHPDWSIIKADNDGVEVFGQFNNLNKNAPLVVFLHGWSSATSRFLERMEIFKSHGCHTLALELRHHGMAPKTDEWTAVKIIGDLKTLLNSLDSANFSTIHFYGHSLGGFLAAGMTNSKNSGWWTSKMGTLMLESPMAAFTPIMEEKAGRLTFLNPIFKWMATRALKKIHPEITNFKWEDVDVPNWAKPTCPTLLLQAANDERLGMYHYNLIIKEFTDLSPHLIQSLSHSANSINKERDELIIEWIGNHISST